MRLRILAWLIAAASAFIAVSQAAAQLTAREEIVRIPTSGATIVATVMRPPGEDKRPLAIINHGSPADSAQRPNMDRPRYPSLSSWFVSRGYVVVLPMRRGYGESGGTWAENYGSCQTPDYFSAGLQGAADIKAAMDYMRSQPYVAADRTIVIGQSAGGWATVAFSSLNPPGVPGMVNFAGGRATLKALGPYGSDGHTMAANSAGVPMWSGPVAEFLASLK